VRQKTTIRLGACWPGLKNQTATVCWYIANESMSIAENVKLMGLQLPGFLEKLLEVLRKKNDEPPEGGMMA
jgi:phage-related holin